jgi:hypothetical protein
VVWVRTFPVIIGKTEKDLGQVLAAIEDLWPDAELFLDAYDRQRKATTKAADLYCNSEGEWALVLSEVCRSNRQFANWQVRVAASATPEVRVIKHDEWLNDNSWILG